MSRFDYEWSKRAMVDDPPFFGLIMAAMRKADTDNLARLVRLYPGVWAELQSRYHAPGGILPGDPCPVCGGEAGAETCAWCHGSGSVVAT